MPLFKFCKPEHHVERSPTLRVGTLYGYRHIENAELRDGTEGTYEFTLAFDGPVTLEKGLANLLFGNAIGFGGANPNSNLPAFTTSITGPAHLTFSKIDDNSVTFENAEVKISRSVENCLIFCMSRLETAAECAFTGYSDHWQIREDAAQRFTDRLGNLIFENVKLSAFSGDFAAQHSVKSIREELGMRWVHRPIVYRDRVLHVRQDSVPSMAELMAIVNNLEFIKPPEFAAEREYRFTFRLGDNTRQFPPIGPVDVPVQFTAGLT